MTHLSKQDRLASASVHLLAAQLYLDDDAEPGIIDTLNVVRDELQQRTRLRVIDGGRAADRF